MAPSDRSRSHPHSRSSRPDPLIQAKAEVRAIYAELAHRPIERQCIRRGECCHFKKTGKTPFLTKGEALLAAQALRGAGRTKLPARNDGACPMLQDSVINPGAPSRCLIYADRPFGCRTHFCDAAGGPYTRKEVLDLIHRLEAIDRQLQGRGPTLLPAAVEEALRELQ